MIDLVVTDKLGEIVLIYPLDREGEAVIKNGLFVQELGEDEYLIDNSDGRLILEVIG